MQQQMYLRIYSENTSNEKVYAPMVILSKEDCERFNYEHFIADSQNNINNRPFGGNYLYCGLNEVLHPAQITQPKMARFLVTDADFRALTDRADIDEWGVVVTIDGTDTTLITGSLVNPFPTLIANSEEQCWVVNIVEYGVSFDRNTQVSRSYSSPYIEPIEGENGLQWPFEYGQLSYNQQADYYYRYIGKTSRGTTWATARTNLRAFHTANIEELLQGGWAFEPDLSVASNGRNLQIPTDYTVSVGCMLDGYYDGQFDIAVDYTDLSSPYSTVVQNGLSTSTPRISAPIVGERSTSGGTPTNESALNDLAYQMVEDYVEYLTLQYDATFRGIITVATSSDYGTNFSWCFYGNLIKTHVFTDPISFYSQYQISIPVSAASATIPDAAYNVSGKINTSDQFLGLGAKYVDTTLGLFPDIAPSTGVKLPYVGGYVDGSNNAYIGAGYTTAPTLPTVDPDYYDFNGTFVSRDSHLHYNFNGVDAGQILTISPGGTSGGGPTGWIGFQNFDTSPSQYVYFLGENAAGGLQIAGQGEVEIYGLSGASPVFGGMVVGTMTIEMKNSTQFRGGVQCRNIGDTDWETGQTGSYAGLIFNRGILTGGTFSGGMAIGDVVGGSPTPGGLLLTDDDDELIQGNLNFNTTDDLLTIGASGSGIGTLVTNQVGIPTAQGNNTITGPFIYEE